MLTKEELVDTYIKYSSDITEEIWDKLVIKFKELGFYLWQNKGYKRYKEGSIIFINEKGDNSYWVTDGYFTPNADKKEIQVSDVLGENNQQGIHNTSCTIYSKVKSLTVDELVEPAKKEFDRNWYIEVNSQEEADLVFQYLESVGERIVSDENFNRKYFPDAGAGYKYIYYLGNEWFLGENPRNKPQKQLSDIIPNYSSESKVSRNVYYEVSNQEQYEEILDWLENKGEKVNRRYKVFYPWYYIYFRKDNNCWELYDSKLNLPKAEFKFKNNPGLREQMDSKYIFPVENLKAQLDKICEELEPKQSHRTIPEVEKVKVQLINVPRI